MEEKVLEALRKVEDPELGISVVDLGLIYGVTEKKGKVLVKMTATTPFCPYLPDLLERVRKAAEAVRGVERARVDLVWDPPWSPQKMSEEAKTLLGFLND
ncbi:MAG: hypothetical protein BMS9Abin34_291 [Patescibacteria group bacterium]|nr:MAG: hypothetical protein BMS9Abin34_291 [Patescibacteria group bacterium]